MIRVLFVVPFNSFFTRLGGETEMKKLFVAVVDNSGEEYIHIELPYRIVETGGPLKREKQRAGSEKRILKGPREPVRYILADRRLADSGSVGIGPRLKTTEFGQPLEKGAIGKLSIWLVGETLPPETIPPETILQSILELKAWSDHETKRKGKWKEEAEREKAEGAARALGFDGLEIVEYQSYQAWGRRTDR